MLFFYQLISSLNQQYSTLLGIEAKETDKKNEGQGNEGKTDEPEDTNRFADKWGWIYNVKEVSDMVHTGWDEVFAMEIREFLNILSFCHDYNDEVKRQNDKIMRKYKH